MICYALIALAVAPLAAAQYMPNGERSD